MAAMIAPPVFCEQIEATRKALADAAALEPAVKLAATLVKDALLGGNKLLACGNGGSASDASHLVTEILIRFRDERRPYPAVCLNSDGAVLTAGGNDYGFDQVFARQVRGLGRPGDVLLAFSTSGNSRNIVLALEAARELGLRTITFLGRDGGACASLGDAGLIVRNEVTARIQEVHHFLLHAICEMIEIDLMKA